MAWEETATEILRVMVNDMSSQTYTDEQLQKTLVVAAFQILQEMDFSQDFKVDIVNITITPDPSATETLDDSFVNLMTLKAACVIDTGSASLAAKQGIYVKDGSSAIDLRGIADNKLKLLKLGWCAVYADARQDYVTENTRIAGAAILGPFRLVAFGNNTFDAGRSGRTMVW